MASAAGPRRDVSSSDVLVLDRLILKAVESATNDLHGLATTYFRRAAKLANEINGETLVSVHLTGKEASHILLLMQTSDMRSHERDALLADAWALTSSMLPFLNRRIEQNALLPGQCSKAESSYYLHCVALSFHFADAPLPGDKLETLKLSVGFVCALNVAHLALVSMSGAARPEETQAAHAFIMRVMVLWPSFAEKSHLVLMDERLLACTIERATARKLNVISPSLQARWNSPAMVKLRKQRDLFDTSDIESGIAAKRSARDERKSTAMQGKEAAKRS